MKRCPTCHRTYTDDRLTNCGHDGAPLMFTAYSAPYGKPEAPPAYMWLDSTPPHPPEQGYAPPPATPWQNYPPTGYPPQSYPPQALWPSAGLSQYVPCPRCARPNPEQINFTWWGGLLGPILFKHVKCNGCGFTYNGKSGESNTKNIVIYTVSTGGVFIFITLFIIFYVLA